MKSLAFTERQTRSGGLSISGGSKGEQEKYETAEVDPSPLEQDVLSTIQIQTLAENVLGPISWSSETEGFIDCPGTEFHTGPNGEQDCIVFLDGIPTVYCFHQSCQEAVADGNRRLRRAIWSNSNRSASIKRPVTEEEVLRQRDVAISQQTAYQSKAARLPILTQFAAPVESWLATSPISIPEDPAEHWRLQLDLFEPADIIWIGRDVRDSSSTCDHFADRFLPVSEWKHQVSVPGLFTCPSTFRTGTFSRCNAAVLRRPFLVVESDVLIKSEVTAVFRWMQQFLRLRAVVDTAGKSLHGWFDFPDHDALMELKSILPFLDCDPALFKPAQPCRLAGGLRNGRHQRLLYLDLASNEKIA
jgi:hypothetical protein